MRGLVGLVVACVALLTTVSCMAPYPMPLFEPTTPPSPTTPSDMVLSPDGRTLAFGTRKKGIGLYDWQTRQVRYLPIPAGFERLGGPSYSADGSKLVFVAQLPKNQKEAVAETRLGIVDLATMKMKFFPAAGPVSSAVFWPNGKAILHMDRDRNRLFIFDLETQTSRPLLSDGGFDYISPPSFISSDTILFVGRGPHDPALKAAIERLKQSTMSASLPGGRFVGDNSYLPYVLRMGSTPELAYPDFVKRQLSVLYDQLPTTMPASRNGERIAFFGLSRSDATRRVFELFVIENGQFRQVTNLETFMIGPAISQDGSTAAVGISEPKPGVIGGPPFELTIVDLNTGQVTRTDFVKRVYDAANE